MRRPSRYFEVSAESGFTLSELVIVLAIIGILSAMAIPSFQGYTNTANEIAPRQEINGRRTISSAYLDISGKGLNPYRTVEVLNRRAERDKERTVASYDSSTNSIELCMRTDHDPDASWRVNLTGGEAVKYNGSDCKNDDSSSSILSGLFTSNHGGANLSLTSIIIVPNQEKNPGFQRIVRETTVQVITVIMTLILAARGYNWRWPSLSHNLSAWSWPRVIVMFVVIYRVILWLMINDLSNIFLLTVLPPAFAACYNSSRMTFFCSLVINRVDRKWERFQYNRWKRKQNKK